MLVDIFSTFDDYNSSFMSIYFVSWLWTFGVLVSFNVSYWLAQTRLHYFSKLFKFVIMSQLLRSFGVKLSGFINVVSGLFLLLIFINMAGLVPYTFSVTSHLAFSFSLGFPLWLSLIISGAMHNPVSTLASLLPSGAPMALNPFLVLVETVSLCVRPITLSIRLVANMSAGHIVLGLIGTYLSAGLFLYPVSALGVLVILQIFYFMFEIGVGLIQAYIFALLTTLYSDDHAA